MALRIRRLSLDSSVSCLDRDVFLSTRRGSAKFNRRSRQSLQEAQLEIQELGRSLASSLRGQTIAEESLDRSDGRISRNSFLKHNRTFHKLFQDVPEGENLTHTFICALQKEVLYHGKLYVSENYVCFHSSVLLKETKVAIPASSVTVVKKHKGGLSVLSIQTVDGEKFSFASLRKRQVCYALLHSICLEAQGGSGNSSPSLSTAENEADQDLYEKMSCESSAEDTSVPVSRNNSIIDSDFPHLSNAVPGGYSSTPQSSVTDEEDRGSGLSSWMRSVTERLLFLRERTNLGFLFYIYMTLTVLLLLISAYITLKIIALEEQLNSLGTLTGLLQ